MKHNIMFLISILMLLLAPLMEEGKPEPVQAPGQAVSGPVQPGAGPEAEYGPVEVVRYPNGSFAFVYKHRWKDWLESTAYLFLVTAALLALAASLGRKNEQSLRVSYFLEGIVFGLSVCVLACSLKLLRLKQDVGLYLLPAGPLLMGAAYFLLMKIKADDISLAEMREAFLQPPPPAEGGQDGRLSSVEGTPGNWPDQDIVK